jgi:hypothetical protein
MNDFNSQYLCSWRALRDERLRDAPPCPFCGSGNLSLGRMGNFVHCETCSADGPDVYDNWGRERREEMWRLAVQRWSSRATQS